MTKRQRCKFGPKVYREGGETYRIIANVRYDDECGSGNNTFSITAEISRKGRNGEWHEDGGGCCHEEVAKHFPELAPLIKWHLCSSDGPLHYIANAVFQAGDRDCWGYRRGEQRRGKNGKPMWMLPTDSILSHSIICDEEKPTVEGVEYVAVLADGKERELDAARRSAIWPDATDEELTEPGLKERLQARLPGLLEEFRAAVESLGFTW